MTPEDQAQAHCVTHPAMPAAGTCSRCGSFICAECLENGAGLCASCLAKHHPFPITRETYSFDSLWTLVWTRFQQEWVMLSVASLVYYLASTVTNIVTQVIQTAGTLLFQSDSLPMALKVAGAVGGVLILISVSILVSGIMQVGMMRICIDVLHGKAVDLGQFARMARRGIQYSLALLAVTLGVALLLGFPVGLGAALLIPALDKGHIPPSLQPLLIGGGVVAALVIFVLSVWFGLPFMLVLPEMATIEEVGAFQAIRNAFATARDRRGTIFLVALVNTLCLFAGLLCCCVGIVPATGFFYLLIAGLYLALRNGKLEDASPPDLPSR